MRRLQIAEKIITLAFSLFVWVSLRAEAQPLAYLDLSGEWPFQIDPRNQGEGQGWFEPGYEDAGWEKIPAPAFWERHGQQGYDGYAWYRIKFELPETFRNQPVYLGLGGVDDAFDLWIDGRRFGSFGDKQTGETYYRRKSLHNLTRWLSPGPHLFAFRVEDWAGGGGIHQAPLALASDSTVFMTPEERVRALAKKNSPALWPYWVQELGQSWTVIGLPEAVAEGLVSRDGALGANTWPFTLSTWLRLEDGSVYAPENRPPDQLTWQLERGFLPLPQLLYGDERVQIRQSYAGLPGVREGERSRAVFEKYRGEDAQIAQIDYEITVASEKPLKGWLFSGVRPYLVNSKVAEIQRIEWDEQRKTVVVNGKFPVWCSAGAPHHRFIRPVASLKLDRSKGDISEIVLKGIPAAPEKTVPEEDLRMIAGLFAWEVVLQPGVNLFQFRAPLEGSETWKDSTEFAPAISRPEMADRWQALLTAAALKAPDQSLCNAYYASLAYILINADRGMPHPGPLAYDLFWYRDTAYMLAALLRNGQFDFARRAVNHLMAAQRPDGEFPPIFDLNYKQVGEREWDSQGQALFSLAEYVFFSGDTAAARRYWPLVERGVAFLDSLQASSKTGILPPSWSAEDLGSEKWHHYWDDFWAVAGLRHAALLAQKMGWPEKSQRLREKAHRLNEATRASYTQLMKKKKISWIPNGPEDLQGSSMARGTSPGLWPGGALETDDPLVKQSFDYYWNTWIAPYRGAYLHHNGFWPYAFELGLCYLRLDEPERAHAILQWHLNHQTFPGGYAWAEVLDTVNHRFQAGDMPHAWVAADYVNLVRGLLVDERGDSLALGAGIPREWLESGEAVGITGAFTRFGKITFEVSYRQSSQTLAWSIAGENLHAAGLKLKLPREFICKSVEVDGAPWRDFTAGEIRLPVSAKSVLVQAAL